MEKSHIHIYRICYRTEQFNWSIIWSWFLSLHLELADFFWFTIPCLFYYTSLNLSFTSFLSASNRFQNQSLLVWFHIRVVNLSKCMIRTIEGPNTSLSLSASDCSCIHIQGLATAIISSLVQSTTLRWPHPLDDCHPFQRLNTSSQLVM